MLMPRRLGVLGGTFNPVHNAHMAMANIAMHEYSLESILFIPTGRPPHKRDNFVASPEHRYNMLLYACEDLRLSVSRMELDRQGFTYTVDTLTRLRDMYPPSTDFFFIVGADTLHDIINWKDSAVVLAMTSFIAFSRGGYCDEDVSAAERLRELGGRVYFSSQGVPDISSTPIRELAAAGHSLSAYVPAGVEEYIVKHRVYG